jgi:teichuronic acid biosynthesis glycosyltransferase TuaG
LPSKQSISVVIPTFNRAQDLITAIRSVLTQSYPVAEIWVCDDGSTDNSRELVRELKEERVKWLDCGRNGRPAIPRNMGIVRSESEWIAYLDSDDVWHSDKIKMQLFAADRGGFDAVCTNGWRRKESGDKSLFFEKSDVPAFDFYDMVEYNRIICSSMMCKRELLLSCKLFPEEKRMTAIEDYVLWLKISGKHKIGYVQEPLMEYNDNPKASIRKNWTESVNQRILIFNYMKKHKQFFSREQFLFLYEKFKWFYKPSFWKKFDLEKLML